jgi:hydrogenase expression/formation protein HypE
MGSESKIILGHGSGGRLSHRLLSDVILKYFDNQELSRLNDGACLNHQGKDLVFSTDSFVVDPVFFPGGDIGKLAVCGTVNDLAMMGAKPVFLSVAFIIEEGLDLIDFEKILQSMAMAANEAEVQIVTGDTKVVPRGIADKIFINTAGIGFPVNNSTLSGHLAKVGDKILINGPIADHGITIMAQREGLELNVPLKSDCAPLNRLANQITQQIPAIKVMRDPTRGGVATTLNEIAGQSNVGIRLDEKDIPVRDGVNAVCEILGLDPLYVANEGKMLVFSPPDEVDRLLSIFRQHPYGKEAAVVGEVVQEPIGKVYLQTTIGGQRMIDMLSGEQLPRIC